MWEVWQEDGHYIKGKRLKRFKAREKAVEYAKETIKYKRMVKEKGKDEFYLEDKDGKPLGMIINKE